MGHNNKKKNKNRNKKKNRRNNEIIGEEKSTQLENEEKDPETVLESDFKSGPVKRQHVDNENDSENDEEIPKKKKKKKHLQHSEGTDKKSKKSIRQMKREKFAERQAAAQAVAKDQLKSQCLNYLSQWKHNKQNWKFMKAKQVWLYKNKFSSALIPDSSWPLLLEYFVSAQGNIRNMLLDDANKVIKQMDEWTESQSEITADVDKDDEEEEGNGKDDNEEVPKNKKPDEIVYKRARELIQCLEE